jgi:6-phospho-3-hexuloisomerase
VVRANDYDKTRLIVLKEIKTALDAVDGKKVEEMIEMICLAEKVFVIGVGRVLLMLQAFVKRLNHIGINANYVGAINEPAITAKDVLVVGSGSGESIVPVAISKVAKKHNARIIFIGSNTKSSVGEIADLFIRIPCRTKLNLEDEIASNQPMSSLFEQSLLLFLDIAVLMIIKRKSLDLKTLWYKHANLE